MLDISRDIQSLTDFKKNTSEFVNQMKQTGEPVVLTINGEAELVVQDAAAYQKLREIAEAARVLDGIRQGIDDTNAARTVSLDEFEKHAAPNTESRRDLPPPRHCTGRGRRRRGIFLDRRKSLTESS